jgi:uncharacterized membrane protein
MSWFDQNDIEDNKLMACLSYLSILFLIPLLAMPQSRFCRAHVNQGILLFILSSAVSVLSSLLSFIPLVNIIVWLCWSLFVVAFAVVVIFKIVETLQGKYRELPLIGKYRIIK